MESSIHKRQTKFCRTRRLSSLHKFCGYWKSSFESPPVRIYRTVTGYKIQFEYPIESITVPLRWQKGMLSACLFERMEIQYDEMNDRLVIAEEGNYFRDEDREE